MLIQVKHKNAILNSDFISLMIVNQDTGKDDGTYRILLEMNGGKCGWVYKEYPSEEEAIIGMENLKEQIEKEKYEKV